MALTNDQLRLLDSCPALSGLKDWIIAVDNSVNPTTVTPNADDNQEPAGDDPNETPNADDNQDPAGDDPNETPNGDETQEPAGEG